MSEKYQKYRSSTLGQTLGQALLELIEEGLISKKEAVDILEQFDASMNSAINKTTNENQPSNKKIKVSGFLNHYNGLEDIWRMQLKNVKVFGVEDEVVEVSDLFILGEEEIEVKGKRRGKN